MKGWRLWVLAISTSTIGLIATDKMSGPNGFIVGVAAAFVAVRISSWSGKEKKPVAPSAGDVFGKPVGWEDSFPQSPAPQETPAEFRSAASTFSNIIGMYREAGLCEEDARRFAQEFVLKSLGEK